MMKRSIVLILGFLLALPLAAQNKVKQQLDGIFTEAEQCYLKDDYERLEACLKQYSDFFSANIGVLGDSTDVYQAYYYKMCGAFYYGFAEVDAYDYYSELCYRRSLQVFMDRVEVKTIQGMHKNAVTLHSELAQLYYKTRRYHDALGQLDTLEIYYDNKLDIDSFIPYYYLNKTQQAMCLARLGNFDRALSQIDDALENYYNHHKNADYYETLRKRGKILMLQADSQGSTHYKKAVDCYQQYVNERYAAIEKEMNGMTDSQRGQYWLATHQFLYDCYRLGNNAPEMLYDLALFSKDYLIRKNAQRTRWHEVQKSLGKTDCAIEFVEYFGRDDEKRLGCLVLKSNSKKPLFIDMFSTDSLLDLPLTNLHTIGSAIVSTVNTVKDTLYNDGRLPDLIWTKPLMKAIGDAQKVYFAPDGLLHQMAIEYLMPDTKKTCYRLTSTRNLTKKRTSPKMESALLCGGVAYGAQFTPSHRDNDVAAYRFLALNTSTIKNLPGAREEVDSIYAFRNNPQDKLLVGEAATDEALLREMKRHYDVIHLSTHGYFGGRIGIYNDIKPLRDDKSMSKSGLLFAGSANTLTDKTFDENMFDGVLSATELSKQDFSKTELIVLSACQTGLGHLTEDGVYGIQRGLKLAGANAMILTLWSVNDYSSSVLLRYFYQELEKQSVKNIQVAFLKARQLLMKEEKTVYKLDESDLSIKKETIRCNMPRFVNPFIIIDAY